MYQSAIYSQMKLTSFFYFMCLGFDMKWISENTREALTEEQDETVWYWK